MSVVSLDDTYYLLRESSSLRLTDVPDKLTRNNLIDFRPKGILVQDTWNNPFFPLRPAPMKDTNKMDLPLAFRSYYELYTSRKTNFLPWHYVVEMIGNRYYVFNTRPLHLKYPLSDAEAQDRKEHLEFPIDYDEETTKFLREKPFLIDDAIHIAIIGDSNTDIYGRKIYQTIGEVCVHSNTYLFRIPRHEDRIKKLNLGKSFNLDQIFKFSR